MSDPRQEHVLRSSKKSRSTVRSPARRGFCVSKCAESRFGIRRDSGAFRGSASRRHLRGVMLPDGQCDAKFRNQIFREMRYGLGTELGLCLWATRGAKYWRLQLRISLSVRGSRLFACSVLRRALAIVISSFCFLAEIKWRASFSSAILNWHQCDNGLCFRRVSAVRTSNFLRAQLPPR